MKLSDREILSMVDQEFESAMGSSDGQISIERANAWRYYNSEPLGNEVEGKSQVVSSDVSDVVDGIMPSLLRLFATKDNLVSFDATGPEDEPLAAQETDYISHVFFKKNEDSFLTLHHWFFDALVQKNGIVKAWWDDSEVITEESYTNLTEPEVFKLLEDEELEAVERDEHFGETVINNQIAKITLHDIRFKRTTKRRAIRVENVPPEEYRISSDATKVNPSKARMVGQERNIKRSELLEMGFENDVVSGLPAEGRNWDSEELIARRGLDEERTGRPDKSQEEVKVREAYIYIDLEGDGRSELRQIFTSNSVLLSNDPADRQPFHVLSSKPLPHKHFGTCPAELVMDIQKVNTTLTRQILDNLYQTNNPGHAVYEQAIGETTMDDLLSTEIGSVTVFDRPVSEAYAPMTTPFTAAAAFPMLEYWDNVKRDRTGVQSDSDALSPDQLKHIQTSVLSASMDMAKGKIELIARIFAETGIKSLFLHIHELLRKHQDRVEVAKLRGEWVDVDPASWRNRPDVTVNIGLGIGSRESNLIHLSAIKDLQTSMIAAGGMNLTVSPMNVFNTAAEIVRNANLKDPEMFFTNPGDTQAPPSSQEQMQIQQQAQLLGQKEQELRAYEDKLNKTALQHEREMLKIQKTDERHSDDVMLELESMRNDLTEMELKYKTDIPDAQVFDYDPMTGALVGGR